MRLKKRKDNFVCQGRGLLKILMKLRSYISKENTKRPFHVFIYIFLGKQFFHRFKTPIRSSVDSCSAFIYLFIFNSPFRLFLSIQTFVTVDMLPLDIQYIVPQLLYLYPYQLLRQKIKGKTSLKFVLKLQLLESEVLPFPEIRTLDFSLTVNHST